jgi:hypothetical protein
MKTICRLLTIGFFIATLYNFVSATPSTQIWIPSTDIQGYLNPHFGWDCYLTNTGLGAVTNAGITIGVLPFKKVGLEVGIDYRDIDGNHQYPVYFNAKLGVPEDAFFKYMPAIAVGGFDFGLKDSATNFNVTYGLIARTLPVIGRLSIGGYTGLSPDMLWMSSDGKVNKSGVLASWDRTMTEISSKLWLAIDYLSGNNGYGALSFGGSWNWAPNVSTIIGYDIWNDSKLMNGPYPIKSSFTFQLDINLK